MGLIRIPCGLAGSFRVADIHGEAKHQKHFCKVISAPVARAYRDFSQFVCNCRREPQSPNTLPASFLSQWPFTSFHEASRRIRTYNWQDSFKTESPRETSRRREFETELKSAICCKKRKNLKHRKRKRQGSTELSAMILNHQRSANRTVSHRKAVSVLCTLFASIRDN